MLTLTLFGERLYILKIIFLTPRILGFHIGLFLLEIHDMEWIYREGYMREYRVVSIETTLSDVYFTIWQLLMLASHCLQ